MAPYMAFSRHELIDLTRPWDPQAVMRQYLADPPSQRELPIPQDALQRLVNEGGAFQIEAKYRSMGSLHATVRAALLGKSQVDLQLDGTLSPSWWLRPVALPFRARLRRLVEQEIDQAIEELKVDLSAPPATDGAAPRTAPAAAPKPPLKGMQWALEITSLDGQRLFQHSEGAAR